MAIGALGTANARGLALFKCWIERAMAAVADWNAGEMLPA